jgi:hypothetical protein
MKKMLGIKAVKKGKKDGEKSPMSVQKKGDNAWKKMTMKVK